MAQFITVHELSQYTVLSGNIDNDKISPFIKIAQDTHIYAFLGSKLFDKTSNEIDNNTLSGNYLNLVNNYVKPMLYHWALMEFIPFSGVVISNKGTYQHNSENATVTDSKALELLVQKSKQIAENYTEKFMKYMRINYGLFPEYYTVQYGDKPPALSTIPGGWYLPTTEIFQNELRQQQQQPQ